MDCPSLLIIEEHSPLYMHPTILNWNLDMPSWQSCQNKGICNQKVQQGLMQIKCIVKGDQVIQ